MQLASKNNFEAFKNEKHIFNLIYENNLSGGNENENSDV